MRTITGVTTLLGSKLREAGFVKNPEVTIGDNIRELLERADISPDRLSKLSGVKKSVVHGILSNSCGISHSDVKKLAAVLPDLKKFETSYRIRQEGERTVPDPLSEREAFEIVRNPKLLRKHMRAFSISEERLSEKSGIRRDLVQEIMTGNKPVYPNTVKKVSQALIDLDSTHRILGPSVRETIIGTPVTEAVKTPEYEALTERLRSIEPQVPEHEAVADEAVADEAVELKAIFGADAPSSYEQEASADLIVEVRETKEKVGLQLSSYVSELSKYFHSPIDELKALGALRALGMLADSVPGTKFTRMDLFDGSTSNEWQRDFLKKLQSKGYLEQHGERRNTRYLPLAILTESPSHEDVAGFIWPWRAASTRDSSEETEEVQPEEVQPEEETGEGPEAGGQQSTEDVLLAIKVMFYEALKGQLEVIVSHGVQLDRIERKLDVTLKNLGIDPEGI
jgi:transcriptional regulator with XRE-family HTH domain